MGAFTGRLNTTAGVRGSASCLVGEDESREGAARVSRLSLVGLSKDELRNTGNFCFCTTFANARSRGVGLRGELVVYTTSSR